MTDKSKWLTAVGVLMAAFAAVPALGDPKDQPGKPADKSTKAAEKADAKAAKAEAKAEEKSAKADAKQEKTEAKADEKAAKADEKSDAKGEHGRGPGHDHEPGTDPQPEHGADRHLGRGFGHLAADFREGKVTKVELKDRIAALRASKDERRKENREELKKHWGRVLADPACREELRHHAKRDAFLSRALFLAQTDATIKDKDKVIARIQKLMEREDSRHTRAMERLRSAPGSAAPGAAVPTPTPAASYEKAGAK